MRSLFRLALPALAGLLLTGSAALADDDHDRALEALREGRILKLERIVQMAKERFGGEILDVELEDEDGGFRYELKVMAGDGRILKLEYDAATGDLLRTKARAPKPVERR